MNWNNPASRIFADDTRFGGKIVSGGYNSVGYNRICNFTSEARDRLQAIFTSGLILFLVGAPFTAQAQTVQTNQAELARQTQPGFTPTPAPGTVESGQVVPSPNDTDLGEQQILKRAPEYQPFSASMSVPIFYTSNVALTPNNEKSDVVIAPVVGAFYDPRITGTLYGHLGAREQIFYYGKNTGFNFGSLDAEAGLNYFLPQVHNLILRILYDFNRLTLDDRLGDEFYSNHQVIFTAELPFRLGRAQQLSLGADANLSVAADHQSPRRNDYEAYLSYSANLSRAFSVNAVGRVVVRDYHQNGRTDVSEILSLTGTYRLTNWCSLSAISSFANSDSNQDIFDYSVVNAGGALSLAVRF
jgi:hypothetical protein